MGSYPYIPESKSGQVLYKHEVGATLSNTGAIQKRLFYIIGFWHEFYRRNLPHPTREPQ